MVNLFVRSGIYSMRVLCVSTLLYLVTARDENEVVPEVFFRPMRFEVLPYHVFDSSQQPRVIFPVPDVLTGAQQAVPWARASGPYRTNDRGQFVDTESFARAISDQLGVPKSVSTRMAEMTKTVGRQMIDTNKAFANFLTTLNTNVPEPNEVTDPIVTGLEAASSVMQNQATPQLAAAVPVITNLLELLVTATAQAARLPADAIIDTPKEEILSFNQVLEAMLPVMLQQDPLAEDKESATEETSTNFR